MPLLRVLLTGAQTPKSVLLISPLFAGLPQLNSHPLLRLPACSRVIFTEKGACPEPHSAGQVGWLSWTPGGAGDIKTPAHTRPDIKHQSWSCLNQPGPPA